jgi:MbtH protein
MDMFDDGEEGRLYMVLVNQEEQYSLWPRDKSIPRGWCSVGKEGTRAECGQYIEEVWTDLRTPTLRRKMHVSKS